MRKKTFFLFIFLVAIASAFIWNKPLTYHTTCLSFKYLAEKSLGQKVHFDDFNIQNGQIELLCPKIGSKSLVSKEGGVYIEADKAVIDYNLDLFARNLNFNLYLERPKVSIVKTPSFSPSLKNLFHGKKGFFDLRASLMVEKGELELVDMASIKDTLTQKIEFEIDTQLIEEDHLALILDLKQKDSHLRSMINLKENFSNYQLNLENFEATFLQNLLYFWTSSSPRDERSLNCQKGSLTGKIELLLENEKEPSLKTQLDVKDLRVDDKKTLLSAFIPNAVVEIDSVGSYRDTKEVVIKNLFEGMLQRAEGVVEIPYGAELIYQKNDLEILKSPDMKGKITLKSNEPTLLSLEGDISEGSKTSRILVEGSGFLTLLKGDLEVKMRKEFLPTAKLRLSVEPYGENQHKLYGNLSNFSPYETQFIQTLLRPFYPEVQTVQLKKGELEASFQALFKNYRLKNFSVDNYQLKEGSLNGYEWAYDLKNIDLTGSLTFSLDKENILKTLNGEAQYQIGSLKLKNIPISNLEGECFFKEGVIKKSNLSAFISEINTELKWNSENLESPLSLSLKGLGKDIIQFAPKSLKEIYAPIFDNESFLVRLDGFLNKDFLNVTGNCKVGECFPANFGFKIERKQKKEDEKERFKLFWDHFVGPIKTMPVLCYFEKSLKLGHNSSYFLTDGWFDFQKVPIEKFVSPILFGDTTIEFSGSSNIKGKFDHSGLSLSYEDYDLKLNHQYFSLNFCSKNVHSGQHYFNFAKNTHFGKVYVKDAKCSVKSAGLDFDGLEGLVEITPERIYADQLIGKVFDLDMSSKLNLTFLGDGDLDLMLNISELKGNLKHFKSLFSSMDGTFFNNLPLEGNVEIDPENAFFHLVKREEITTKIGLSGKLTEGKAPFLGQQPLSKINCLFSFDSDSKMIEIKDFESCWKSHRNQTYGLFSNYFKMNLFEDEPSLFDVKIKNAYKDCARLSGKLYFNLGQDKPILKIILDQKESHIGSVDLTNVYFALNESFKLDYLNVNFACNLNSVSHDVSLVQNLIPQLSGSSIGFLKLTDLKGDVSGQWVYDLNQNRHQFFVWGDQVKIGDTKGGFFQLKGYKQNNTTLIEDMTYLDLKGSCKIEERPFCFFINNFKMCSKQDLELYLSGVYCKIFNSFQADVERFYCNLSELKKLDLFSNLPYVNETSGNLNLKGKIEGGYYKGDMNYSLNLFGKASHLKVREVLFDDEEIKCSFKGNSKGIKIEHFESKFLEAFQKPICAKLIGNNISLNREIAKTKVEDLQFEVNSDSLLSIQSLLKEKWNIDLPESSVNIKKEGLLEGAVHYDPENEEHPLTLSFKEGRYQFLDQIHFLNHCKLFYGKDNLSIEAKGPINNKPYWLQFDRKQTKKNAFNIHLYDQDPESASSCLKVECINNPQGTVVKNISGTLAGMRMDFIHRPERDTQESSVLMGQMQIQGDELIKRLPWDMATKLDKFSFGKGYFLTGQLKLSKSDLKDFIFEGLFGGQDFDLFGFEFKSLSSSIICSKDQLLIQDLKLSDLSGELFIDKIDLCESDKGYGLYIPKILVKDFKPSLLHRSHQGPVKHKPLIINRFEVKNLSGTLSDLDTLKGEGYFTFEKTPKKQSTLLDIPVHLISKLGLDLTMLNPVEGKVLFEIKNQKLLFTRLIDVYSHDRHCHFTLPRYPEQSYMDFDGNLNIKIKMKQYVLLKITEPFMISVQGHYSAPRYSFTRKKVVVDVPEKTSQKVPL